MKLSALIIDDEPLAHRIILEYVQDIPFIEIMGQCYQASDAYSLLNQHTIELIFLDINMPKIKGIEFLHSLRTKPLIIITSAHREYALEGFELDVSDYLLKPYSFQRFLKAVHKAYDQHRLQHTQRSIQEPETHVPQQIFIRSDKKMVQLDLSRIYYLESFGNFVKVWLEERYYLTARTLSSFEPQLPFPQFIRVHKSFLCHMKYIEYVEGNTIVMKNNIQLPVGKNYKKNLKDLW